MDTCKRLKRLRNLFLLAPLGLILGCSIASSNPCQLEKEQMREIEQARGLNFKAPVSCRYLEPEEIVQELRSELFKKNSPQELRNEELLYKLIGGIPIDYHYVEGLLSGYSESIKGFYHIEDDYFALNESGLSESKRSAIDHELVHALQDQNFDLSDLLPKGIASDSLMARQAVFEGDALRTLEALESEFNCRWHGKGISLVNAERVYLNQDYKYFPPFLRLMAGFPYSHGVEFFCRLMETYPSFNFDLLFSQPPLSTAEILHPELYQSRIKGDSSLSLDLPPYLAEEGWFYTAVLGEYALFSLLAPDLGFRFAKEAAAGWAADRAWIYRKGEGYQLDFRSHWQTKKDAIQFYQGWAKVLAGKAGQNKTVSIPDHKTTFQLNNLSVDLQIEGLEVRAVVLGTNLNGGN